MTEFAVRIEPGGRLVIDVGVWVEVRTGGTEPALTADLRTWASRRGDTVRGNTDDPGEHAKLRPDQDWADAARSWCHHRGHEVSEPGLIAHAESRLNAQVGVLLATTRDGRRIAVVGINHDPPTVHLDTTPDPWWWCDADSVVITCPDGHTWLWQAGREVLTADDKPATLTTVFGPSLDAPFSLCQDCTAFHLGSRTTPCDCDRSPWILCPTCGQRCGVDLPQP